MKCWSVHLSGASALSMCAIDSMRPGPMLWQKYRDAWRVRVRTKGWPPQLIHVHIYVHHVDPYQIQSIKTYQIISDALNSLLIILNRWLMCLCENGSALCDCLCVLLWLITISRENVRSLPVSYSAIQSYSMYSASDIFYHGEPATIWSMLGIRTHDHIGVPRHLCRGCSSTVSILGLTSLRWENL